MAEQAEEKVEEPQNACVRGLIFNGVTLGILALTSWATLTWKAALVSCGVNWLVFLIHALPQSSEKFFDATGTLTYVTLIVSGLFLSPSFGGFDSINFDLRQIVLAVMVMAWSIRLGSYLLMRICRDGKDERFDSFKVNVVFWLGVWSMQALWCYLIALPALIIFSKPPNCSKNAFTLQDAAGYAIWVIGMGFEVIADRQKDAWRQLPENKGKFITVGLWSRSRHPNYFGEITIWIGVCLAGMSCFQRWDFLGWLSPITTFILLNYVSGVPLLEATADKRWGGQPEYEHYKANTPCVFPSLTAPPPFKAEEVPLQ